MTPARSRPWPRSLIERLWQRSLPLRWWPLWAFLTPAAALYSGVVAVRARWWRTRSASSGATIISVGNLTVGGNSKTPFALFLASRMRARGLAVAIVSRGWGRTLDRGNPVLVSDGTRCLKSPREAGDEPVMLAKSFAGPIAVARRRIDAINLLRAHGHFDAFILDDGFQHLRLRRDLDLLLINATRGFGNGWVLPAGPLRERRTAIARAHAIVLIDSGAPRPAAPGKADLALPADVPQDLPIDVPIFRALIRARALVHADSAGWHESPLALGGRRVVAVSGLADPAGFHAMLRELGATISATLDFPDHHDYTPHDFENLLAAARGADLIVTTEKDLVKLELFPAPGVSLYALRLEVSMDSSDEARLFDLVAARMQTGGAATSPRTTGGSFN
jgi:tetraacyldisaccharide 4'-kinase